MSLTDPPLQAPKMSLNGYSYTQLNGCLSDVLIMSDEAFNVEYP